MSEKFKEFNPAEYNELKINESPIPGLFVIEMPVHGDNRGWFKENYQKEKMEALGLPDFQIVQNNISFNAEKGVTRGLHAEPWDKYISTANGSVYGAWCDLREGSPTYGETFTHVINPGTAIFVPRGVANGFQALEDNTTYTYLVTDHWSPNAEYSNVSIFDKSLNLSWPIALNDAIVSDKDKGHPELANATPIKPKKILVTGANGQLGKALREIMPEAEFVTHQDFDITNPNIKAERHWRDYSAIINAAAYTAVDKAETPEGRSDAWNINANGVANLAKIALQNNVKLVHISSDYVFDGQSDEHDENEAFSPLGVYGQSKAAGDIAAATAPNHYIVRTSWVVGDGNNFIKTMQTLAERDIKPEVVSDQIGRLSFTEDIASGIKHLLDTNAPSGTYNLTNSGKSVSWFDIAQRVYELSGKDKNMVSPVTTDEYYENTAAKAKAKAEANGEEYQPQPISPRPLQSTLNIGKIQATGYDPRDWEVALQEYLAD